MKLDDVIADAHEALEDDRAEDAITMLTAALAREPGAAPRLRAQALGLAAFAAHAAGREAEGRTWSDQALSIAKDDARITIALLEDRAELELSARATETAASFLRRAIALRSEIGEADAETWLALAEALLRGGELEQAQEALDHTLPLARAAGDGESAALAIEMSGDIALATPDAARAREAYAQAFEEWRAFSDEEGMVRALVGSARAAELAGDDAGIDAALEKLLHAIDEDVEGRDEAIREVRALR